MSLSGSLATMPLPDLLQWLGTSVKTGTLSLERDQVCKQIELRRGRIVACSSDDPPHRLGHFLLSRGKITEDQLRHALGRQETERRHLGALLVSDGALEEKELVVLLAAKSEEILLGLFDWTEGSFRFEEGDQGTGIQALPADLRVEELVLRGARRLDEAKRIRAVFRDPGMVLRPTAKVPPPEISRNRLARLLYESVDGERTVGEIVLHAHASEFLVHKFLFELFRSGMVEVCEVRRIPDEGQADPERRLAVALETSRKLALRGEHDAALDLLQAVYRVHPQDDALRRLVAEAEIAFVDRAYRHDLPAAKVPVLVQAVESLTGEDLSPAEFFLLSRIDGSWNVKSIIQIAPLREVDALRTLKRMRDKGLIRLKDPG
jgi:hypothetical protein